jgi:hypothetical protein
MHVFPDGPGDVNDDDDGVHLVVLPMTKTHVPNTTDSEALKASEHIVGQRSAGPRINRNLLVFIAPTDARIVELRNSVKAHLAWKSIEADRTKLDLKESDLDNVRTKIRETDVTVEQRIPETFQSVFVPEQTPGHREIQWHIARISAGTGTLPERAAKKLESEEKIISRYSGPRIRMDLDRIPLWSERQDISVSSLWKAYCQFPYMPRLASRQVLEDAIAGGTSSMSWAEDTFAWADAHDGTRWVGLKVAERVTPSLSGLLVHPEPATAQLNDSAVAIEPGAPESTSTAPPEPPKPSAVTKPGKAAPTQFFGTVKLSQVRAIKELEAILQNVVDHLAKSPGASIEIAVDITAKATGFDERTVRVVGENANNLKFTGTEFSGD